MVCPSCCSSVRPCSEQFGRLSTHYRFSIFRRRRDGSVVPYILFSVFLSLCLTFVSVVYNLNDIHVLARGNTMFSDFMNACCATERNSQGFQHVDLTFTSSFSIWRFTIPMHMEEDTPMKLSSRRAEICLSFLAEY